ncbi:hypothetical protein L0F63_006591, partial [Massospora cicadina]
GPTSLPEKRKEEKKARKPAKAKQKKQKEKKEAETQEEEAKRNIEKKQEHLSSMTAPKTAQQPQDYAQWHSNQKWTKHTFYL